ncbi:MAG: hypothetical protein ABI624_10500 [Casimicrobiaceae bacterium]
MTDPRTYPLPARAPAPFAALHALAEASLAAATGQQASAYDQVLGEALDRLLQPDAGDGLAQALGSSPSAAIYRHMWRLLAERERAGAPQPAHLVRLFALPVIIVAGSEEATSAPAMLPAVLPEAAAYAALLREHGALAGNETVALGNALVAAEALDLAHLPRLLAWRALPDAAAPPRALAPAPIHVAAGAEGAHLRFLVGSALAAPGADLFRDATVGKWGMPLAQALSRALALPGISVLALPRAPLPLVAAVQQGRLAQREVGAQLFASNAIRKLRAATGEPAAVISVHRLDEPSGQGEVRLSLSSPFDPRAAEGFRCPLLPGDRVDEVVHMLTTLLAECRVGNVRLQPGIHADRDPATGLTLLFKGEGAPPAVAMH